MINITRSGNNASHQPSISDNGRYISFVSSASNLTGDGNAFQDAFRYDAQTFTFQNLTHGANSATSMAKNTITPDGRYVTFQSTASNLVVGDTNGQSDVFLYDTQLNNRINITLNNT